MSSLRSGFKAFLLATATISVATAAAPAAHAQDRARRFDIPAQSAANALNAWARQAGAQIVFPYDAVQGRRTPAVRGDLAPSEALSRLTAPLGLEIASEANGIITLRAGNAPPGEGEAGGAAADSGSADDAGRILVVGSRLGVRSPAESALPIRVITREEIDRSGATSIAQALSYLPEVSVNNVGDRGIGAATIGGGGDPIDATTVQLRGLPSGTTLILINGRRAGESSAFQETGQFDLSTIPLAMVERIEVMPAGSSAIYGGDALAGVVNIVLRRDASGLEVRASRSMTEGHAQTEASILWGRSWSDLRVTAGATWRRTGQLTNFEREITGNQNYTRFGGVDFRSSSLGFPANVYSLAGCPPAPDLCFVPLAQRGNLPGLNSSFATVPAGQNGQNLTAADFVATAGTLNRASSQYNLFSPSTSWSLNFSGSLDLARNLELFAEFAYERRDVPAIVAVFSLFGGDFGVPQATVLAGNPFNPFGVDVGVNLRFSDTGVLQDYRQSFWRALLGARWRVGRWNLELAASQVHDRSRITPGAEIFDLDGIVAALQSTNSATAINPFVGDGSLPWSPQLLESLLAPVQVAENSSTLRDVTATARGPLLRLPAGDVLLLVGGEYQRQSLSNNLSGFDNEGDSSRATFAEMRVPLLKGANDSYERLTLSGAWRREWSDRFDGSADTQTATVEFRPWQTLLLRGTYSTSFKPPVLSLGVRSPIESNTFAIDPKFGNQFFPVRLFFGGGIPDGLRPEKGTSRTLGVTWLASANFRASATWWDTRLRDRLATPTTSFLLQNEDLFAERITRDPGTGFLVSIDRRTINISRTDVSGIDLSVEGRWTTSIGDFIPTIAATYVLEHDEQVLPTLPVQNNLGVLRQTGWSPRWKIVPRLGWDYRGIVYANLAGRYVSGYTDPQPLSTGPNAGQTLRLGNFWLIDLNVQLDIGRWLLPESRLLAGTRLSLGVNNLFDRLPDFCNSCGISGYDASQYDIVGRRFHAALRFSF